MRINMRSATRSVLTVTSRPLVFSLVPRSQAWYGWAKNICTNSLRCSDRSGDNPVNRGNVIGFRVVRCQSCPKILLL